MARERSGTIPSDGVVSLLARFEAERQSGLLRYVDHSGNQGEFFLRLGQVVSDSPLSADGSDPVERFLALRAGSYELLDRLPALEDTDGTDRVRVGSLGRYSVADLMNYAESAGLTGLLRVERAQRVAEIHFELGSPDAIYLDGNEENVDEVFGWGDGRFTVRVAGAPSLAPPSPESAPRPEPLVIERSVAEVLDEAESRRPRTAPSIPPPKIPIKREGTVRIVMLGTRGEALVSLPSAGAPNELALPMERERMSTPRVVTLASARRLARTQPSSRKLDEPTGVPRFVVVVLALVLFSGVAAFVAILLRMA